MPIGEPECLTCKSNSGQRRISPGCTIYEGQYWQVEHAYPCALAGWLVLVLKRHAEALHELTEAEFEELGRLQGRTSKALFNHLDCEKEYCLCLAEAPGFQHIHFQIVAKPKGLPVELTGAKIFALLKTGSEQALPVSEIQLLCKQLREVLLGYS